jgi:hypothetical protein
LLDTNICGETQVVGDLQGQYYWEQNSYFEEQPIWPYQQSQQNVSADTISYLEEAIKQMNENSLQMQSSLQSLAIQVEQIVSNVHQFQERKMLNDDVQPVALLEVMQCDTNLHENQGEPIKTLFVSSDEHTNPSECMKEIIPQNSLKYDLDELYASLEVDKSFQLFSCECGICNVCHEISAAISGEYILMPPTTCAEIRGNSTTFEFDTKSVDFSHKQPLSIAEKLLVEPPIKQCNTQLSFTICAYLPPFSSDSQANRGLSDFHTFVIADLPYVLAIPPKPPNFLLISKFTCYLLFLVSYVRSAERPPPKPPDMKATVPP